MLHTASQPPQSTVDIAGKNKQTKQLNKTQMHVCQIKLFCLKYSVTVLLLRTLTM